MLVDGTFLQPGTQIISPGRYGTTHHMVSVGHPWRQQVVHASKERGGSRDSLEAATGGQPIRVVAMTPDPFAMRVVEARAHDVIGIPYTLGATNCEHIASFVMTGTPSSPQLQRVGEAVLLGLLIGIALGR